MESSDIVTLSFYNYSSTPVFQKWSASTLRMLPFFESLFSGPWKDLTSPSYVMDCDPNDFIKVIDNVRYGNKDRVSVLSSSLGLTEKLPGKITMKRQFCVEAVKHIYELDSYSITRILSLRWLASSQLTSFSNHFKISYNERYYSFEQNEALIEKMNEKLISLGKIGYFAVLSDLLSQKFNGGSLFELTLIIDYE